MKTRIKKTYHESIISRDGGYCVYGLCKQDGCSGGAEIHHIIPRSIMRLDIPLNLITLCSGHHRKAENRDITQTELFDVLGDTYNYDYEQFIDLYREYIRS